MSKVIFKIEDTDTPEVKEVKGKFNEVYDKVSNETGESVEKAKSALAAEIATIVSTNADFKAQLEKVLEEKAKWEEKMKDHDEALLEINRLRTTQKAEADKGVTFKDAFDTAIDENVDELKKFFAGKSDKNKLRYELKAVGDMGLSSISNLTAANVQLAPGIVPFPSRRVHMRDIMSTGRMVTSLYNFLKEIGFDGSIGTWQENSGAKPQFDIRYKEVSAEAEFIAGWIRISRKSLDDIPALKSSLAFRLLQKYLDAEDSQILNGTGANGQLLGLFNSANSITYVPGKTKSVEMLVDSITLLEQLNHTATGIVLDPAGYNNALLSQSSGSTAGIYSLPGGLVSYGGSGMGLEVAGVKAYKTTAMATNVFLTGDWEMGAQLLFREDPVIEFFEQDGDNVKNNQITVRVEGRVALPCYYNDAFVHGTYVNPGS
jgi:HK97 family phage major capsid protein